MWTLQQKGQCVLRLVEYMSVSSLQRRARREFITDLGFIKGYTVSTLDTVIAAERITPDMIRETVD